LEPVIGRSGGSSGPKVRGEGGRDLGLGGKTARERELFMVSCALPIDPSFSSIYPHFSLSFIPTHSELKLVLLPSPSCLPLPSFLS